MLLSIPSVPRKPRKAGRSDTIESDCVKFAADLNTRKEIKFASRDWGSVSKAIYCGPQARSKGQVSCRDTLYCTGQSCPCRKLVGLLYNLDSDSSRLNRLQAGSALYSQEVSSRGTLRFGRFLHSIHSARNTDFDPPGFWLGDNRYWFSAISEHPFTVLVGCADCDFVVSRHQDTRSTLGAAEAGNACGAGQCHWPDVSISSSAGQ